MVAICVAKLSYSFISILSVWQPPGRASHHARSRVLSDEGVPQDLGQLAGSEGSVRFVPAQSANTLLEDEESDQNHLPQGTLPLKPSSGRGGRLFCLYLERQQALVDLSPFQASLAVGAGRVRPPFVARQVDQGELPVHFPPPSQDDLEHGVAPRGVGVSGCLARRPAGGRKRRSNEGCSWG